MMGSTLVPRSRRARPGPRRHPRDAASRERAGHGPAASVPAQTVQPRSSPRTQGQPSCPSSLPPVSPRHPGGRPHLPSRPLYLTPSASRWVLAIITPFQVKTQGSGNNAQTKQSCQRGEETLSRQKVPLPNNISVSDCTMLSCPAPLSRLYGKYYINGFVQIDS